MTEELPTELRRSSREPEVLRGALGEWLRGKHADARITDLQTTSATGMSSDTLLFDASGNATGRTDQSSTQAYTYLDPYGACYDRTITTDTGVLATVTDGTACPDGVNTAPSFDSFHNAGSLTFGATLQILP